MFQPPKFFMFATFLLAGGFTLSSPKILMAHASSPYRAADVISDIRNISSTGNVSPRLLEFIDRWESHNVAIGDLESSVGWRLCTNTRDQDSCYSGAGNTLDHTIGWGLCMASGRNRSDCFSGAGNTLDQTIGWGLCMASGRNRNDCFSGAGNTLDETIGWGLCMSSGRNRSDCFSGAGNTLDETIGWGLCMADGNSKFTCLQEARSDDSF